MNWDEYFYKLAELTALKSKDQHTKIGAVIVGPNNEIRSTGYNSFPRGLIDTLQSRQERPEKYFWFEHAERNAIYNSARVGTPTDGCRMFVSCGIPCADCARAVIQAGIVEVIIAVYGSRSDQNPEKWKDSAHRSTQMFKESGVSMRRYFFKGFE